MNAEQKKKVEQAADIVRKVQEDIQQKYDNMSETAQEGEAGEQATSDIDLLEAVISAFDDLE